MKKIVLFFSLLIVLLLVISIFVTAVQDKVQGGEKIGLIRIEGPILSSKDTIESLKEFRDDTSIKAIVLRIDTPGGAVVPAQEIYREVKKTYSSKKVIVSMGSLAASGGYYIAAAATKIVANPGTITGSIGVIMEIPNIKGLLEKIGIASEVIKSGEFKDMASYTREMDDNEKLLLQNVLDDVHTQFIEAVSDGRGIPAEKVREIADGRIFTGLQAKDLGLVDILGNLQDSIKVAAEMAGIEGDPDVVTPKDDLSIVDMLVNTLAIKLSSYFPSLKLNYLLTL